MSELKNKIIEGSFRDPSGFVFFDNGVLYRQINKSYKENYDHLMGSGLYDELVSSGLLVSHEEVAKAPTSSEAAYKIIRPQMVDFISYPYEWCFSQLKDAGLTTLAIQKKAFKFGMVLKDATAFNIQYENCKPTFIDTLSFEKYRDGEPWVAYKQFCQHFLGPVALMAMRDIRLSQLLRVFIDGIELDLVSKLLPFRSWLRFSLLSHVHLHARTQIRYSDKAVNISARKVSTLGFRGIIDSLEGALHKLKWQPKGTEWADYYDGTNYSQQAMSEKEKLVLDFIQKTKPKVTWDLGANTGLFSRLAKKAGSRVIAFDIDPAAVEKNYRSGTKIDGGSMLPLVLDLTNPSGGIGWGHNERMSLLDRGPADTVLALALIHHLAISNNVPLEKIAEFFHKSCQHLVIEFVPKEDSQVKRLLATREDIFPDYTFEGFEAAFAKYFETCESAHIKGSDRKLYLMHKVIK